MIDHAGAPSSLDIDQLWLDPASVFASPEDLMASDRLSTNRKIDALRRWEYDAAAIEVAEEEGMPSHDEHDLLRRILLVLGQLATVDTERVGPTKQHGLSSASAEVAHDHAR